MSQKQLNASQYRRIAHPETPRLVQSGRPVYVNQRQQTPHTVQRSPKSPKRGQTYSLDPNMKLAGRKTKVIFVSDSEEDTSEDVSPIH